MNIEKDITDLSDAFPLKVYNSIVRPNLKEHIKYYHWHDFLEITCVKSGKGRYLVNGKVYEMQSRDIILFNNAELHVWEAYEETGMMVTVIIFSPVLLWNGEKHLFDYEYLKPFLEMNTNFNNKLPMEHPYTSKIYELLMQIEEEFINKPQGYPLMIKVKLLEIMTYLIRHFQDSNKQSDVIKEKGANLQRLQKVLTYINDNYTNTITLQTLSEIACMNPNYFSSFFNSTMGFSFTQYISSLRVNRAELLIKNTQEALTNIAFDCGFNSLSNFNRVFKLQKGISPSELRKK